MVQKPRKIKVFRGFPVSMALILFGWFSPDLTEYDIVYRICTLENQELLRYPVSVRRGERWWRIKNAISIWMMKKPVLCWKASFVSRTSYCIGAGLALDGKKVLLIDVDPQGDLTKMLGLRKPHDLPRALGDLMSDVVSGKEIAEHTEIMHHHEGFDFVPGNRALSAVETGLVNVMSRETVLRQYVDSVKNDYDYVLLDCRPSGRPLTTYEFPSYLFLSTLQTSI